jgi:hypothetical protein
MEDSFRLVERKIMKVEVSHLALKNAIKMLSMFVSNADKPEHKKVSIYYNAGQGRLELKAGSNIGIARVCVNNCKASEVTGDLYIVDAEQFFNIVKGIYSDVTISVDEKIMKLKFGKSVYKIPIMSDELSASFVELFNKERSMDFKPTVILDAERMQHKIKCISHCISTDDALVELSAICVDGDNMLASDSVVGGITKYDGLQPISGNLISRFPITFVDTLNVDKIGIKYTKEAMLVSAERPEYSVSAMFALQSNNFPLGSIKPIVADSAGINGVTGDSEIHAVFSPTALSDAIARLCVLADDNVQGITMSFDAKENDFCELTIDNHSFTGYEKVHVVYNTAPKAPYSVKVDGKQLLKSLKVMNGDCYFSAKNADDVQFLSDVDTTIFFYGLQ